MKATSAWVGQGQMVPTGSSSLYFVGRFRGVIFVENAEGVISRSQTDQIFARWACSGTHGVKCRGAFELTSGTGRFSGIRGRSDFRVRSGIGEVEPGRGSEVREVATGLAEWSTLTYTIP